MLARAILSAVFGTVAMTLSSTTEMQLRGRPASLVPALATNKLLRPLGVPQLQGRALDILGTWTHWVYGAAWGVLFWLLVDVAGLALGAAGVLYFLAVWLTEQVELPVLGLTPPPWKWGIRENVIDAWHHAVYASGTVVGWVLLGHVV